jgi:hypothetical protein
MKLNPDNFKSILKNLILEQIKEKPYLQEIFDSKPFKTQFDFHDNPDYYYVPPFNDPYGNIVKVYFYKLRNNCFEIDFTVNGDSYSNSDINYSTKDYSVLINTICKCMSQFIEKFTPNSIVIEAASSEMKIEKGKESQKNDIYRYASIFLEVPPGYKLLTNERGGFSVNKKIK